MKDNLVYDIGMHNGDDTAYYLSLGYHVVSVEASPDLVENAAKIFKEDIDSNRLTILNKGINAIESYCDFYLNKTDSVWNSFNKELGARGGKGFDVIRIPTVTLASVIEEFGCPYYLKIDIEGYDIFCLDSLLKTSKKPEYISVELSQPEIIERLKELGYTKFKIIEQWSFLNLALPMSKKYQMQIRHQKFMYSMNFMTRVVRKLFGKAIRGWYEKQYLPREQDRRPFGSSGSFGERLPGEWMSKEEAVKVFSFYVAQGKELTGRDEYEFWADIHATM